MNCPNCGTTVADPKIEYCPVCGSEILAFQDEEPVEMPPIEEGPVEMPPIEDGPAEEPPIEDGPIEEPPIVDRPIKTPHPPGETGIKKALIAGIVSVILIVVAIIGVNILTDHNPSDESIYLSSYIGLEFAGEDGSGEAIGSFDYLAMISNYPDVFRLDDKKRDKIRKATGLGASEKKEDSELLNELFGNAFTSGTLQLTITPASGLKNKDQVVVAVAAGESTLEDIFAANFVCDNKTFTVEGLIQKVEEPEIPKEIPNIYMSSYIGVSYSGYDGEGEAKGSFKYEEMLSEFPDTFTLSPEQKKNIISATGKGNESDSDASILKNLFGHVFDSGVLSAKISPDSELENNDTVSVYWVGGQATLANIFEANFIFDQASYTVKGLEKKPSGGGSGSGGSGSGGSGTGGGGSSGSGSSGNGSGSTDTTEYISLPNNLRAPAEHFLFPYSSQKEITKEQLDAAFGHMNNSDRKYYSQLALDEIFFRYGWQAAGMDLTDRDDIKTMLNIFNQYDWYQEAKQYYPGDTDWYTFEQNYMNSIEKANINRIVDWQMANVI